MRQLVSICFVFACSAMAADVKVIAEKLNEPRHLAFSPSGELYVAEAGSGGNAACRMTEEGERCSGLTGRISRIDYDLRRPVPVEPTPIVTGLSSEALTANNVYHGPAGLFAHGPSGISFHGSGYVALGFEGGPADRIAKGAVGATFGYLGHFSPGGFLELRSDLAAYEAMHDPDGRGIDSDPYAVLALPGHNIVVDSGGNSLLDVSANGTVRTLAVFPRREVPNPFAPGIKVETDSVPTCVALGPDGYLYVGELTGAPFAPGQANIYRIPLNGLPAGVAPPVFASGFNPIMDIAFDRNGKLLVLDQNLYISFGRLMRYAPGVPPTVIVDNLIAPTGLTVGPDGAYYISAAAFLPDLGQILRVTE